MPRLNVGLLSYVNQIWIDRRGSLCWFKSVKDVDFRLDNDLKEGTLPEKASSKKYVVRLGEVRWPCSRKAHTKGDMHHIWLE